LLAISPIYQKGERAGESEREKEKKSESSGVRAGALEAVGRWGAGGNGEWRSPLPA